MAERSINTLVVLELDNDLVLDSHPQWHSTLQQVYKGGSYAIVWGQVLDMPRQVIVVIGQSFIEPFVPYATDLECT